MQTIGSLTRQLVSSLDPSVSTQTPNLPSSETIGTPLLGGGPPSSIGELLGELGVEEPRSFLGMPAEYGQWLALRRAARSETWRSLSPCQREVLRASLYHHINRLRAPAHPAQISLRVEGLLAHYYQPSLSDEVRTVMAADWVRAMAGTPLWALDVACTRWLTDLEKARRRPLPAELLEHLPDLAP